MLFINFLCLLYLMVLIDSHTISKSIDNDEKVDDIFDSITDLDHTRNPKQRRDRFLHKYRADYKDEYARPAEALKDTKLYPETDKTTETTTPLSTTEHPKPHKSPKRRVGAFWRKFRGKEKDKKNKLNDIKERNRRIPKNKKFVSKLPSPKDIPNSSPRNKSRRKNRSQFVLRQPPSNFVKRDVRKTVYAHREHEPNIIPNKLEIGISPHFDMPKKQPYRVNTLRGNTLRGNALRGNRTTENLKRILASMTTQITHLKHMYGLESSSYDKPALDKPAYNIPAYNKPAYNKPAYKKPAYNKPAYNKSSAFNKPAYGKTAYPKPAYDKPAYGKPTSDKPIERLYISPTSSISTSKVSEVEYPGTEQIEQLLNDIKSKAIQMVSEQNPSVTDIITNTVTEATFEADPILTHIDVPDPGYYLSSFLSINDIATVNEKRTVKPQEINEFNLNDSVLITNTESHYLAARSIKEDTMTLAHNVEDLLERELKNIYQKVKNKVSNDFHKVKSTIKNGLTNPTSTKPTPKCKTSKCKKCPCKNTMSAQTTKPTTGPRHSRGEYKCKHGKKLQHHVNDTPEPSSPTPTYDDYMMLTLYEQMLSKTHEDNVRKMLSTVEAPIKKRREHFRLSKRNPETLTDVKLREDVQKLYDDGLNMPYYDYIDPTSSTENSDTMEINFDPTGTMGISPGSMNDRDNSILDKSTSPMTTDNSISDTSYEGLSNKISYNDFVNGYKHYLKFQKEQNNQNFSNLIKYQAHRHHSVDDIGKFILSKIPPLPVRKKRIFDDNDIDYQEISTKSDDSWFRKHFYLFIDNGPPKKFHTSQTVALKSAMTEPNIKLFFSNAIPRPHPGPRDQVFIKIGSEDHETTRHIKDTADMSLDDLTKVLDSIKEKHSNSPYYSGLSRPPKETYQSTLSYNGTNNIKNIEILPHGFIGKFFGGKRRHVKKFQRTTEYFPLLDMFTENLQSRYKRTASREDSDGNAVIDDFINKNLEEKASTKEVDAKLKSNKEPNKYGYVAIDLVPRQTAVVKLRETTPKRSKFRSRLNYFIKKFNFKKDKGKEKDKKKVKRSYYQYNYYPHRRSRFNPIKKLKDMFKGKPENKESAGPHYRVANIPDYDMMTSHIDTFKPVKYDKPLTIDEMKKQIPNISDIFNFDPVTRWTTKFTNPETFKLDENDHNLLYNYKLMPSVIPKQFTEQIIKSPTTEYGLKDHLLLTLKINVQNKNKEMAVIATTRARTSPTKSKIKTTNTIKQKIPPSNVMTVNLKTLKTTPTPVKTVYIKPVQNTPLMTLDDMKSVLNSLQYKLSKTSRNYHRYSQQHHPRYSTQHYKRGTVITGRNIPFNQCRRPHLENLTIKSKLTRIAKFPISKRHFKNRHGDSQLLDSDYLSFQEGPADKVYKHEVRNRNASPEKIKMAKMGTNLKPNMRNSSRDVEDEKCRYTDYFNDLLMWHNDILNLDKVPSPLWKNILKNIQSDAGQAYTTPNMNDLMRELNEINAFLDEGTMFNKLMLTPKMRESTNATKNENEIVYASIRSVPNIDNINKQGIIRSVAMNDHAIVTSKNMIIKGEAKYYQYNKPKIEESQLNSGNFITKLNKIYNYGRKSNEEMKVKENRRNSPSPDNKEEPAILVDTTLMAYDDDVDSITRDLEAKKLSRNSEKSSKASSTGGSLRHSPFLKTNKAPEQYYTTPLPMKSHDFEKFLKEHKMDVESVTAPIFEMPTIIATWKDKAFKPDQTTVEHKPMTDSSKIKTKKISLATQKLTKMYLKNVTNPECKSVKLTRQVMMGSHPLPINRNMPHIRNKLFNIDNFDRYKRYSDLEKFRNLNTLCNLKTHQSTTDNNYYNMFKKKMRFFEKKAPAILPDRSTTGIYTLDPRNKEVEITIINFDDIDKLTPTFKVYEPFTLPTSKEDSTAVPEFVDRVDGTTEFSTKTIDYMNTQKEDHMHNELLYKDIFRDRTTSSSTELTPTELNRITEYVDPLTTETPSGTVSKLHYPFDFLNKIPHSKNFNLPKRVHISSHHYKYDIFYNDERKTVKSGLEDFRPKQNTATSTSVMQQMKLTDIRSRTNYRY